MPKKRIPSQNHNRTSPPKHLINQLSNNNGNNKHNLKNKSHHYSKFVQFFYKQSFKLQNFAFEALQSKYLAAVAIFLDIFLTLYIINNVKYTEIDWSTYMTQVGTIFGHASNQLPTQQQHQLSNSNYQTNNNVSSTTYKNLQSYNFNYSTIEGPTGPLVYPAGHVYIFKLLFELTDKGTNILKAQYIFAAIYIAQLALVYMIYNHRRTLKVPPYIFLFLSFTSYRIHSIYVLRLFNDPIAILFAYASFYALLRKKHSLSALLFGIALSVKMNVLLFAPAFALIFYEDLGILKSIQKSLIVFGLQTALALPFLYTNPAGYLTRSFDFGRVFLHRWTVNWRFLDEETFSSKNFFIALLLVHCALLLCMFSSRWLQFIMPRRVQKARDDPFLTLAITNFIGIAFSRSLHYQFYVWYYHSLPIILWATNYSVLVKLLIFGIIEYCWNQYPSTSISSLMLHTCHLVILVSLLTRNISNNKQSLQTNNNNNNHQNSNKHQSNSRQKRV